MKAKQASNKPETLCWRARFLFSLVASLMLVYTFAVVAPLEIVASSVNSLLFTVTDVWVPFAVVGLAGTVVLALALSLLRGRRSTCASRLWRPWAWPALCRPCS